MRAALYISTLFTVSSEVSYLFLHLILTILETTNVTIFDLFFNAAFRYHTSSQGCIFPNGDGPCAYCLLPAFILSLMLFVHRNWSLHDLPSSCFDRRLLLREMESAGNRTRSLWLRCWYLRRWDNHQKSDAKPGLEDDYTSARRFVLL